ncbi:hypothetical protein LZ32DRAFT_611601 [Colletotrichum eremochloae]|nr:hypothetical protein LZ32DRAFT_611601 [Colletotrichum eremochloae]
MALPAFPAVACLRVLCIPSHPGPCHAMQRHAIHEHRTDHGMLRTRASLDNASELDVEKPIQAEQSMCMCIDSQTAGQTGRPDRQLSDCRRGTVSVNRGKDMNEGPRRRRSSIEACATDRLV